jgi:hypothetical protein
MRTLTFTGSNVNNGRHSPNGLSQPGGPRIDDGFEEEDDGGDHPIEADDPGLKDDDASHELGYRGDLAEETRSCR